MVGAVDRVTTDSDASALPVTELGELPNRFVSESAGTGNHADIATLVDVTRSDANAAATMAFFTVTRSHDARAVRSDKAGFRTGQRVFHPHHVHHRNAFGDAYDQVDTRVSSFQNRIGRKWRGNKNHRGSRTGFVDRLADRVKNRHDVFKFLPAFSRSDAGDEFGSVFQRKLRVTRAKAAGDALNQDLGVFVDEDGHGGSLLFFRIRDVRKRSAAGEI